MNIKLDSIYTRQETIIKTKSLFNSFLENPNNFSNSFEDLFNMSPKFIFGNASNYDSMFYILDKYYKNDFYIRYSFLKEELYNFHNSTVFEYPILNSRADIVSVSANKSMAFEIKTKYDNYKRLLKQVNSYSLVFEFVYVVCPKESLNKILKILPSYCGLYVYNDRNTSTKFIKVKLASLSPNLDFRSILNSFDNKSLEKYFNETNFDTIFENYGMDKINKKFKLYFKKKFAKKSCELLERGCKSRFSR